MIKNNPKLMRGMLERDRVIRGESIFDYEFDKFKKALEDILKRSENIIHDVELPELSPSEKLVIYNVGLRLSNSFLKPYLDVENLIEYSETLEFAREYFEKKEVKDTLLQSKTESFTHAVWIAASKEYSKINLNKNIN